MSWDNYYGKHCTRFYGWLPASKAFKEKKTDSKLTYLTLCDVNAIDIFMFEMEGILERDENKALTGVTICEIDERKIPEIFQNINPPLRDSIVKGKIQTLLLFEDSEQLKNIDPDSDVRNITLRRRLNMRRDALRLQEGFPFDIINFDPCDSILHPDKEMFKAFDKLFELQKKTDNFLIFSTTPITLNDSIVEHFRQDFNKNLENYLEIREAAYNSWNASNFDEIADDHKKAAIGFGKTLIAKLAIKHGFRCEQTGIYIYESKNGTYMLSAVSELTRSTENFEIWYPNQIVNILNNMPTVFSLEDAERDVEVKNHLEAIIESRKAIQKEFMT